jgi:hypothetical protein
MRVQVQAVYGCKAVSLAEIQGQRTYCDDVAPVPAYSDAGATAMILAWTYGGAAMGWIAGEVLLAVAKGALQ